MSMSDNANVWIKNVSRTYNEVYWFNTKTGESTWSIWINYVSRTYNEVYWFNTKTGESRWPEPTKENVAFDNHDTNSTSLGKRSLNLTNEEINPNNNKRLKKDQDTTSTTRETSQTPNGNSNISTNKVGIIVPFRDLHIEQHRKRHLEEFIPTMINLFTHAHTNFSIYVIEQSKDNRKFNRGKLLNIGFDLASKEGCNIFVFHDVDLIPSPELIPYYINKPHDQHPVHIARVWSRYNDNPNYFGGIVAFTEQQFRKVNGFPNNFWGWGGEDDELYQRVKKVGLIPEAPKNGSVRDLENMNIEEKMNTLRSHRLWKCMNKTELLAEHNDTWTINGLNNLDYEILFYYSPQDHYERYEVDVRLNNHWTDRVCGENSNQLDLIVQELKEKYTKQSMKS